MDTLLEFKSKLVADGKSEHTVSSYCRDVKSFLSFADDNPITEKLLNEYFSTVALLKEKDGKKRNGPGHGSGMGNGKGP